MKEPLVSVIMPIYNAGEYLRPSVLSILNQTYKNIELVMVDDGSKDKCVDTIMDIQDARMKIFRQDNGGRSSALNKALAQKSGDYWIIQDADDISYPTRVEKQLEAMEANPSLGAVYIGNDILMGETVIASKILGKGAEECKSLIEQQRIPAHDATGLYRSTFSEGMDFDVSLPLVEGIDFVIRFGEKFPIAVIDGCYYSHRVNRDSITHQSPTRNVEQGNKLAVKTCERRGIPVTPHLQSIPKPLRYFKHRQYDTIVSYCMDSIRQNKQCGNYGYAFKTALTCSTLHPLDPLYHKPFLRFLTPEFVINLKNKR